MVECHPDISQILYRCQSCLSDCHLELQTHWQQLQEKFVCSLFVGVQYCQITKPCLCGKWQIRVTKVKKKITIRKSGWAKAPPPPSPTPCAVPVMRMEDYFMSKTSQLPYYRKLTLYEINANRLRGEGSFPPFADALFFCCSLRLPPRIAWYSGYSGRILKSSLLLSFFSGSNDCYI